MSTDSSKSQQSQNDPELLTQMAINAALNSNWSEAAKINQQILNLEENNIEAMNRLAKAFLCEGNIEKAQKTYKKVLELDAYNIIARKNMDKISKLVTANGNGKSNGHRVTETVHINLTTVFLTEPGKTKTINLLNLASPAVLASLNCGDRLTIQPKKHSITIATQEGIYLGVLPDDLSFKMLGLISGGNKYEAFVKFATTKALTIFLREVERSSRFANQPSFHDSAVAEDRDGLYA